MSDEGCEMVGQNEALYKPSCDFVTTCIINVQKKQTSSQNISSTSSHYCHFNKILLFTQTSLAFKSSLIDCYIMKRNEV